MRLASVSKARNAFCNEVSKLPVIGKGSFSVAFVDGDKVLLVSNDPIKECLSFGWLPEPELACVAFPEIARIGYNDNQGCDLQLYKMPLYTKVTAPKRQLNKTAYAVYKELQSLQARLWNADLLHEAHKALDAIPDSEVVQFLKDCLDGCANYTDRPAFEISPRNIATNNNGDLILLDCFFCKKVLTKTRGF